MSSYARTFTKDSTVLTIMAHGLPLDLSLKSCNDDSIVELNNMRDIDHTPYLQDRLAPQQAAEPLNLSLRRKANSEPATSCPSSPIETEGLFDTDHGQQRLLNELSNQEDASDKTRVTSNLLSDIKESSSRHASLPQNLGQMCLTKDFLSLPVLCQPTSEHMSLRREYSEFGRPLKYTSEWLSLSTQYTCTVCMESFTNTERFYNHVKTHYKNYTCQICDKVYRQVRAFRAHMTTHKNSTNLQCDICNEVLSSTEQYLTHLSEEHHQKELDCCEKCGRYFRDRCTLYIHMRTHTGDKPYKCLVCNKTFRQSGTYRRHLKLHAATAADH